MTHLPDDATRKSLTLPNAMWADVSRYRETERIATEAEAIRRLLQSALRSHEREQAREAGRRASKGGTGG